MLSCCHYSRPSARQPGIATGVPSLSNDEAVLLAPGTERVSEERREEKREDDPDPTDVILRRLSDEGADPEVRASSVSMRAQRSDAL